MRHRLADIVRSLVRTLRDNLGGGSARRRRWLHAIARSPLEAGAAESLAAWPEVSLTDLVDLDAVGPVDVRTAWTDRGSWSIGLAERSVLECLVRGLGARRVFEIGTYNGGTTAMLAAAVGTGGEVVTLDLPPDRFAATQTPGDLDAHRLGERSLSSPYAGRVVQLSQDSLHFDATPYASSFDLVLVDGAHDYEHGRSDTRTALVLVRAGGLVVLDDMTAYWAGLVRGVAETAAEHGLTLERVARTNLAVIRT